MTELKGRLETAPEIVVKLVASGPPGPPGPPGQQGQGKKLVTVALPASAWDRRSRTQTVQATGVLADETAQLIQIIPASASMAAYRAAGVLCVSQGEDCLTFTADSLPDTDLTVYAVIEELRT